MIKIYNRLDMMEIEEIRKLYGQNAIFLHYTGSIYGIGAYADSVEALMKLEKLKNYHVEVIENKSYIVLFDSHENAFKSIEIGNLRRLAYQYWPGNLTVVGPKRTAKYNHVTVNKGLGVRVAESPFLRKFIQLTGKPIISSSVNKSGEPPITDIEVLKNLDWFDFGILDDSIKNLKAEVSSIVGIQKGKLKVYREGSISEEELMQSYQSPLITFVCTGNICRSPMAEYYFRFRVKELGENFRAGSAGLYQSGVNISENSVKCLAGLGIESSEHLSTQVNSAVVRKSFLILTMTESHKVELVNQFPNSEHKIYTLGEFSQCGGDIADPYQSSFQVYKESFERIKNCIEGALIRLESFRKA